ncbi:unnamed protein product [Dovyalis caffra]|uniref:Uncharacterized protein n=1 Tax=Dovyalis caffra TaxID=77055 RepID=A0AAV1S5F3_9ROSI|nr:unnamed protein product [Dovyalis caffra]
MILSSINILASPSGSSVPSLFDRFGEVAIRVRHALESAMLDFMSSMKWVLYGVEYWVRSTVRFMVGDVWEEFKDVGLMCWWGTGVGCCGDEGEKWLPDIDGLECAGISVVIWSQCCLS